MFNRLLNTAAILFIAGLFGLATLPHVLASGPGIENSGNGESSGTCGAPYAAHSSDSCESSGGWFLSPSQISLTSKLEVKVHNLQSAKTGLYRGRGKVRAQVGNKIERDPGPNDGDMTEITCNITETNGVKDYSGSSLSVTAKGYRGDEPQETSGEGYFISGP